MDELYAQLLEKSVPSASMACMLITAILSVAIPVLLALYLKKKYDCSFKPLLVGMLTWIVFARIVEALCHQVILGSSIGTAILGNVFLYALYGGAMAAIFEETGRLLVMKTALRTCFDNDKNALMYGTGHGGIESILILGFPMLSNLMASATINSHNLNPLYQVLKTVSEEEAVAALSTYISITEYPAYFFLLGIVERIPAIALHLALSVLVWKAVKENKMIYFVLALIGHFLADFVTALASGLIADVVIVEVIVVLVTAAVVAAVYFLVTRSKDTNSIQ